MSEPKSIQIAKLKDQNCETRIDAYNGYPSMITFDNSSKTSSYYRAQLSMEALELLHGLGKMHIAGNSPTKDPIIVLEWDRDAKTPKPVCMFRFLTLESPSPLALEIKYIESGKTFIHSFTYERSFVQNLESVSPAFLNSFAFKAFLSKIEPGNANACLAASVGIKSSNGSNGKPNKPNVAASDPPDEDIPF